MKRNRSAPALILAAALVATPLATSWAELKWDNPTLEIKAKSTDPFVVARYTFTNTGPDAVTFTKLDPSCECLRAKPEKKTVAAGGKGAVEVTFYVESRVGKFEQTITVETEDEEPVVLKVKMDVTGEGIDPSNFTRPMRAPPKDMEGSMPRR